MWRPLQRAGPDFLSVCAVPLRRPREGLSRRQLLFQRASHELFGGPYGVFEPEAASQLSTQFSRQGAVYCTDTVPPE